MKTAIEYSWRESSYNLVNVRSSDSRASSAANKLPARAGLGHRPECVNTWGMTSHLQVVDLVVNKSFNGHLRNNCSDCQWNPCVEFNRQVEEINHTAIDPVDNHPGGKSKVNLLERVLKTV